MELSNCGINILCIFDIYPFILNKLKNHKIKVSSQTSIFFVGIESRLDVIFFRRRIRPTIYSCHQFIHHFGLEVNNKLETCPQLQIKVGDLLTIPSTF